MQQNRYRRRRIQARAQDDRKRIYAVSLDPTENQVRYSKTRKGNDDSCYIPQDSVQTKKITVQCLEKLQSLLKSEKWATVPVATLGQVETRYSDFWKEISYLTSPDCEQFTSHRNNPRFPRHDLDKKWSKIEDLILEE